MTKQEFLLLMIEKRAEYLLLKNIYENDDIDHETFIRYRDLNLKECEDIRELYFSINPELLTDDEFLLLIRGIEK